MKVYTSRYSNPALANFEGAIVGITVGNPRWPLRYKFTWVKELAPSRSFVHAPIEEYTTLYIAKLDMLGIDAIVKKLEELSGGGDIILLCFEDLRKPGEWCHRTMLADYLQQRAGIVSEELPDPSTPKA